MTEEQKKLLLKDLCGRLPYAVKVKVTYYADYPGEDDIEGIFFLNEIDTRFPENLYWIGGNQLQEYRISRDTSSFATCSSNEDEVAKPYLFPLSSMTDEQKREYESIIYSNVELHYGRYHNVIDVDSFEELQDFYHKNHLDYRGLIPLGLAIDATGLGIY